MAVVEKLPPFLFCKEVEVFSTNFWGYQRLGEVVITHRITVSVDLYSYIVKVIILQQYRPLSSRQPWL
jgi:hypothetical protein